ncbi:MAG: quinone-dependent dihydroorotate dehydrogenase [Candidatus Puniceispirillaceae bacterium]
MWQLAAKLTSRLPAELAHNLTIQALRLGLAPVASQLLLPTKIAGMAFDNPVGLAAGFDKNAEAYMGAFRLGFGCVEVGTITPLPQMGNPRPRVFRLTADDAVINRYGFNSKGMRVAAAHLSSRSTRHGILGVNIGANKLSQDKAADYHKSAAHLSRFADYLTVNLSSPNTPGLRDLQHEEGLRACLQAAFDGRDEAGGPKAGRPPIFVKLAPDLDAAELFRSMDIALDCGISGFILTNTTTSRPANLSSALKDEAGGLSGQPLTSLALQKIAEAAKHLRGSGQPVALIGVGGIGSAEQAYARLLAGADLVQLYTALALQGPLMVADLLAGLRAMMKADGLSTIADVKQAGLSAKQAVRHAAHVAIESAKLQSDN